MRLTETVQFIGNTIQILACQKVFQAAHTVLLEDLKSCEPSLGGKGKIKGNVRTLKWLQPQYNSNSRYDQKNMKKDACVLSKHDYCNGKFLQIEH